MAVEEERFRPLRPKRQIQRRPDDPPLSRTAFNHLRWVYGANQFYAGQDTRRERRPVQRVKFVQVKPVCFPIFVEAECEVIIRLAFEPIHVRDDLLSLRLQILPVQIQALRILPAVQNEPQRIQAWTERNVHSLGPLIVLQQLPHRQRASGFVPVNSSGDIDSLARLPYPTTERDQPEGLRLEKALYGPAALPARFFDLAKYSMYINPLPKIAIDIPP
jgi:hypothetical protein